MIDTIVDKMNTKDPLFKIETHALLSQYKDLFSRTLSVEPALLPPLSIEIDRAKFETRKAQGPYRLMSVDKDKHMAKFIEEGLRTNVIRRSSACYYSQVHLVAKPHADALTQKHSIQINEQSECLPDSVHPTDWHSQSLTPSVQPTEWRTTIDYRHYNTCIKKQHLIVKTTRSRLRCNTPEWPYPLNSLVTTSLGMTVGKGSTSPHHRGMIRKTILFTN